MASAAARSTTGGFVERCPEGPKADPTHPTKVSSLFHFIRRVDQDSPPASRRFQQLAFEQILQVFRQISDVVLSFFVGAIRRL